MVAAAANQAAAVLARTWEAHGAAILTPRDLSTLGWRFVPGRPELGRAVVAGERVAESEIDGVLSLLPAVTADQLPWIAEEDRIYAAGEMQAFLFAWLSAVECPVLGRPSAGSLSGVAWPRERWLALAAANGLPIRAGAVASTVEEPYTLEPNGGNLSVTVIRDRVVGSVSAESAELARRLATAAGTDLLVAEFAAVGGEIAFVSAHPFPDVCDPQVAAELLQALSGGR